MSKQITTNTEILSIVGGGFWAEPSTDTVMLVGYRDNRDAVTTGEAVTAAMLSLKANGYKVRQSSPDMLRVRR